jgi:fructokinase
MANPTEGGGAEVLCVGEVLWDAMPAGLFLGGAPHNVAHHLAMLGVDTGLASRVGDDVLGREALARLHRSGVDSAHVQIDPSLPTGFVHVAVDGEGKPGYDIVRPAAWDRIEVTDDLLRAAATVRALVFGSLAQRDPVSRNTVREAAAAAPFAVLDVNLRPPFVDREVVNASMRLASVVKMNEDELREIAGWHGWPPGLRGSVEALVDTFGCEMVCITRGDRGAVLRHGGSWTEHPGFPVEVRDTVGSGDAFLAALLAARLAGLPDDRCLARACRLGAFVATRQGATPEYDVAGVEAFRGLAP